MIKRQQVELPRPRLALVGRPNVGKSTLFNRLLGTRKSVVSSLAGTTRDRLYGQVEWRGIKLTLIDSGGMELTKQEGLTEAVQQQIHHVVEEADGLLLICDAKSGWLPADQMIVERLRRLGKPIILVLNKADHRPIVPPEFFALGLDRPLTVSALHGHGTGELLDRLVDEFAAPGEASSADPAVSGRRRRRVAAEVLAVVPQLPSIAIVGRQNVGKSSLLNAFLEEERVIVSEQPGTTRDAIDIVMQLEGQLVAILDTAGLRHRRKIAHAVDFFSISRTRRVIGRCSLALALLDGAQPVTRDDRRIIAEICREGCGLMLLVNKWDVVKGGKERTLEPTVRRLLAFASFAPVLAVSAKTGFHVPEVLSTALRIMRTMKEGLSDTACTSLVQAAWGSQHPPRSRGRPLRFHHARWLSGRPPRLELTISPAMRLPEPFEHYLSNRLHADPRLVGIPLGFIIKGVKGVPRPVPVPVL